MKGDSPFPSKKKSNTLSNKAYGRIFFLAAQKEKK